MTTKYLDSSGLSYFWGKLKDHFQAKLVSGTNIKTINNNSLLGSGNISISGGSTDVFFAEYGVTTYSAISSAINDGKSVFATRTYDNGVGIFQLGYEQTTDSVYTFFRMNSGSTPQRIVAQVDSNDNWTQTETSLGTFPIDSIYITSTNSDPSSYLGGTWTLFDKEFTYKWETSGFTFNTTNTQNGSAVAIFNGHNVEFRLSWENKVAISDTSIQICKFAHQNYFTNGHVIFPIAYADALNAIGMCEFDLSVASNAELKAHDWVTRATSYPTTTGQTCRLSCTFLVHDYSKMVDSKCNKFYWKRTA